MITLEVCAESLNSATTAALCGAGRVELCDNMAEGGTTPSYGNIKTIKEKISIPLFPIIRPRGGDFVYSDAEFELMKEDVKICGECGCEGIVTGILTPERSVDIERTKELVWIASCYGMETTFHRAFDACGDLFRTLEAVIVAGCTRLLTSGGAETAAEGTLKIKELVRLAAGRISIMPGSGVTPENAAEIVRVTGCTEIHGTFRSQVAAGDSFARWQADPDKIAMAIKNLAAVSSPGN